VGDVSGIGEVASGGGCERKRKQRDDGRADVRHVSPFDKIRRTNAAEFDPHAVRR
jgi:hypothetical protein